MGERGVEGSLVQRVRIRRTGKGKGGRRGRGAGLERTMQRYKELTNSCEDAEAGGGIGEREVGRLAGEREGERDYGWGK